MPFDTATPVYIGGLTDGIPNGLFYNYIMRFHNLEYAIKFLELLGFNMSNKDQDVVWNLLWYATNFIARPQWSKDEIKYISSLTKEQLEPLLGREFNGANDLASLITTATTGYNNPVGFISRRIMDIAYDVHKSMHQVPDEYLPNYDLIKNIAILAKKYDEKYLPPYMAVAKHLPTELIPLYVNFDLDQIMNQFGIPDNANEDKLQYVIYELLNYRSILNRTGSPIPKINSNINMTQLRHILRSYTLQEIVSEFQSIGEWKNRNELIKLVLDKINPPPPPPKEKNC